MELGSGTTCTTFERSEEHCKDAYQLLLSCSPAVFQYTRLQAEVVFQDASHSALSPLFFYQGKWNVVGKNFTSGKSYYTRYTIPTCTRHIQNNNVTNIQHTNGYTITQQYKPCILFFRNRPSFPLVYTTGGTFIAAAFSGTCTTCGKVVHHSSYETKGDMLLLPI